MTNPLIQVSLDSIDFYATLQLTEQIAAHVDIFEVGTPCLKHNGIQIVQALRRRFPNHKVLVDLKTMDAGEYEASPFYAVGADICTVLGLAGAATIEGVVKAARAHGAEVQVDLLNVPDATAAAKLAAELGAHIVGVQSVANSLPAFADLKAIADLGFDIRISAAGNINATTAQQAVESGASIVVAESALFDSHAPTEAASKLRDSLTLALV